MEYTSPFYLHCVKNDDDNDDDDDDNDNGDTDNDGDDDRKLTHSNNTIIVLTILLSS